MKLASPGAGRLPAASGWVIVPALEPSLVARFIEAERVTASVPVPTMVTSAV
jgi:non-ribosomal peptide synthetase component E (peptide arylation enzyme)